MEFWGVEVKPGKPATVDAAEIFGAKIYVSQAALGEATKGKASEPVLLYMKVGEQKLVVGTLIRDTIPQISLGLYMNSEFELSHDSKDASVYFTGCREECDDEPFSGSDDFSESDEDLPVTEQDNGKPETKAGKVTEPKKAVAGAPSKQVKIVDPKKDESDDSDDESDGDDDSDDEDGDGSSDEIDADSDSDEEIDSDEDDEEETPVKKVEQGKKRPNEPASKTPVSAKKAKNTTPEKTDGKKNVHVATPHPMKKGGKSPNSAATGKAPNSAAKGKAPNGAAKGNAPNSAAKGKSPNSAGQNKKSKK